MRQHAIVICVGLKVKIAKEAAASIQQIKWLISLIPSAVLGGGALLWQASREGMDGVDAAVRPNMSVDAGNRREPQDAVLVFGSTGKLGRLIVQKVWAPDAPQLQQRALRPNPRKLTMHRCCAQSTETAF